MRVVIFYSIHIAILVSFLLCNYCHCIPKFRRYASSLSTPRRRREELKPDPPNVYRSYQGTIYCTPTHEIQYPKDLTQLLTLATHWIQEGQKLKVIGSRHSITDIICTDGIPISLKNINYCQVNPEDGTASFGAGIVLEEALSCLEKANRTLIHVPAYGGITLGGAIGTGAHGSSLRHPTTISDQVARLKVIDGNGILKEIQDPNELQAFGVNLGLLGLIVEITLFTVPLFKIEAGTKLYTESFLMNGTKTLLDIANSHDWAQMWWFPSTGNMVVLTGDHVPFETEGNATSQFIPDLDPFVISTGKLGFEALQTSRNKLSLSILEGFTEMSLYNQTSGKPPLFSEDGVTLKNPATGVNWRMLSNVCNNTCAWNNGESSVIPGESSIAIPASKLFVALQKIREILNQIPATFPMVGVFIRFSKASENIMSLSHGRQTATIEWANPTRDDPYNDARDGLGAYQAIMQTLVYEFDGRPHWGKNGLHYFTHSVMEKALGYRRNLFIRYMKKHDPNGVYLNKFGKRILGISDKMDMDPLVRHCALQDYCICSTKHDCGTYQTCAKFGDIYRVCRDIPEVFSQSKFDRGNLTSMSYTLDKWLHGSEINMK